MNKGTASASPPGSGGAQENTTTQDKVQEATGQARDKAREAAGKAQNALGEQVDRKAKQAGERVTGTAGDLRSVSEELRKQGKDGAAGIADRAAEQAEKAGSYLSGAGPDQMLRDAEDLGRRRPWAMLAGGLALGAVAARFLKASSRSRYQQRSVPSGPSEPPALSPAQAQSPPRVPADRIEAPASTAGVEIPTPPVAEPTGRTVVGP